MTGPKNRARLLQLRAYAGAPLPIPAQHAAAACWADEAHVEANRALYREKYAIADEILGNAPGYMAPEAGFFLWLEVGASAGDGEAAAVRLWREAGVRALPGAYLSRPVSPALGGGDPGRALSEAGAGRAGGAGPPRPRGRSPRTFMTQKKRQKPRAASGSRASGMTIFFSDGGKTPLLDERMSAAIRRRVCELWGLGFGVVAAGLAGEPLVL